MKPFDKNFTITPHVIDQQLAAWKELLDKRDADMAAFPDTVAPEPERGAFDDDDLDEVRKSEVKRDKWHRELGERNE